MTRQIPEQQYITYMEQMIATPGWAIFVEEAEAEIYALQADALEAPNWEAVQRSRGAAEKLAEILSLPRVLEARQQAIAEEADASL